METGVVKILCDPNTHELLGLINAPAQDGGVMITSNGSTPASLIHVRKASYTP